MKDSEEEKEKKKINSANEEIDAKEYDGKEGRGMNLE